MMYPFYYKRPYRNYYPNPVSTSINPNVTHSFSPSFPSFSIKSPIKDTTTIDENLARSSIKSEKKKFDYFEILGLKLHYDDLIIIGLILLLFSEGVDDQLLIISLVLLIGD